MTDFILTETTTRQEFADHLKASATSKFGTNAAIAAHAKKVAAMSDADWPAHRAGLIERRNRFAPTAARLAAETIKKTNRGRAIRA